MGVFHVAETDNKLAVQEPEAYRLAPVFRP
jgi:hypothetical protein